MFKSPKAKVSARAPNLIPDLAQSSKTELHPALETFRARQLLSHNFEFPNWLEFKFSVDMQTNAGRMIN